MKGELSDLQLARAQELLAQRATEGLDAAGHAELERLGVADIDSFDLAAAAVEISTLELHDEMSSALEEAIVAQGMAAVAPGAMSPGATSTAPAVPAVAALLPRERPVAAPVRAKARWVPWAVAGAGFALAAAGWILVATRPSTPPAPSEPASAAIRAGQGDTTRFPLAPGAGEVLWSASKQAGRVHLASLPTTDAAHRYQVWIVDRGRDGRFPVDAGLFEANGGAIDIALAPRLPVIEATGFFITLEDARGAVVSDRAHVVASSLSSGE